MLFPGLSDTPVFRCAATAPRIGRATSHGRDLAALEKNEKHAGERTSRMPIESAACRTVKKPLQRTRRRLEEGSSGSSFLAFLGPHRRMNLERHKVHNVIVCE